MSRGPNNAMGASVANGPGSLEDTRRVQGWDIRPSSSWVLTIGQDPA